MTYDDAIKTPEGILQMADAEIGPLCMDDEYQRRRTIMAASEELLEALEELRKSFAVAVGDTSPFARCALENTDAAIAKARGEA